MFLKLLTPTPTGTTINLYLLRNSVVTCAFRYDQCLVKVKVKAGVHILYGTIHLVLRQKLWLADGTYFLCMIQSMF